MSCIIAHNFINENGYEVCIDCGEAKKNHYWSNNQIDEVIRTKSNHDLTQLPPPTPSYNKSKWFRLLKTNNMFIKNKDNYVIIEILYILNQLSLSNKVKKELFKYMLEKNISTYKEVWETFYKVICVKDLPITTAEFINCLNKGKRRKKAFQIFRDAEKNESVRKYYWYITKCIENGRKILGYSHKEGQEIFKIVFNYYNLIRFGMYKATNPINLIQNLTYYAIREKLNPNNRIFNKKKFGVSTLCYTTQLLKYLKEAKEKHLDALIPKKLFIYKL